MLFDKKWKADKLLGKREKIIELESEIQINYKLKTKDKPFTSLDYLGGRIEYRPIDFPLPN